MPFSYFNITVVGKEGSQTGGRRWALGEIARGRMRHAVVTGRESHHGNGRCHHDLRKGVAGVGPLGKEKQTVHRSGGKRGIWL